MNPPRKKGLPSSPQNWLNHAESDLSLARLAQGRKEILSEQVCFHAQQAVEKALKAVLLRQKIEFPLIHDLDALLEIANRNGIFLPQESSAVGFLTPYAVETRYPGFWEEITPEDVHEAVRLAEAIVAWAKVAIKQD